MNILSKDAIIMHPLPRVDEVSSHMIQLLIEELQVYFENRCLSDAASLWNEQPYRNALDHQI